MQFDLTTTTSCYHGDTPRLIQPEKMEHWQESHIKRNITSLIKNTTCNQIFLSILVEKGHLGDNEQTDLNALHNKRHEQATQLYQLLRTRTNSYQSLKYALRETKQSGALEILNKCNGPKITYNKNDLIGKGGYNTKVVGGMYDDEHVAVKMIPCDNEDDTERVKKEIDMMLSIDPHENIVKYHHSEVHEEFVLIALERCTTTLEKFVGLGARKFGIDNFDPWSILKQTSLGVNHLHQNNLLHGDLKPTNVLLIISNEEITVKICDFGLAKTIPADRTSITVRSSMGLGTEGWVAPEVLKGLSSRMSLARDVFSLGCIYYFVLSNGKHPYGDQFHRQANIVDGKVCINDEYFQGYNCQLKKLVLDMIAKEPAQRPSFETILAFDPTYDVRAVPAVETPVRNAPPAEVKPVHPPFQAFLRDQLPKFGEFVRQETHKFSIDAGIVDH